MRSNILSLDSDSELSVILDEVDKTSKYNELDSKQALRLRLLAEEVITMLPHFLDYCDGEFWIENNGKEFSICVSVISRLTSDEEKHKLLQVSTSGKNAAYYGIMGKIRGTIEFLLGGYTDVAPELMGIYDNAVYDIYSAGNVYNPAYTSAWSLSNYREDIEVEKAGKREAEWDELEKSIIANLADDVIVGIKGNKVDIEIKKNM